MNSNQSIESAGDLFKRFLSPYWKAILAIVLLNMVIGFLTSLRPLVLAPALGVFIENEATPAKSLSELSLHNLGPTLVSAFNLDSENILNIGIFVAVLFVVFTMLIAGIGMLTQTVVISKRTAILRDMIIALHKHLLTCLFHIFIVKELGILSAVYLMI